MIEIKNIVFTKNFSFIAHFLCFINHLLPLRLKFAKESFVVLVDNKQKGIITLEKDLKSTKRSNDIAYPRQIAMYLCKQLTTSTLVEIGKQFGGRDHTTVLYACNRIEEEISINPNTKMIVDNIKKMILG